MATWEDYERLAKEHLEGLLGWARTTGSGVDAGIDIEAPGYVAQVKAQVRKAGRPDLQRLVGASGGGGTVFYSLGGYSAEATAYANEVGTALFEFSVRGEAEPVNDLAHDLGLTAEGMAARDEALLQRADELRALAQECLDIIIALVVVDRNRKGQGRPARKGRRTYDHKPISELAYEERDPTLEDAARLPRLLATLRHEIEEADPGYLERMRKREGQVYESESRPGSSLENGFGPL